MPHDIVGGHIGHNHAADHLHSHVAPEDEAADLQTLTDAFMAGFEKADDKTAYLRLAGVPFDRAGSDGRRLKLVDVEITRAWQVGTAAPAFGSPELSYMPFPGEMVRERANLGLVYVSATEKDVLDIRDFLRARGEGG